MKLTITLDTEANLPDIGGENLTSSQYATLKYMLGESVKQTLGLKFNAENQQKIAEEIGYRKAITEFLSYCKYDER